MAEVAIPLDMTTALQQRAGASVTQFNRLEGRPRTQFFDRALRAEVRDALWMLTRQWQVGEFRADDAGAPALAQMRIDHTRLTHVKLGQDAVEPMVDELPLEARVERLPLSLRRAAKPMALDLRLQLGRQWLKLISDVGGYADAYRTRFPLQSPNPSDPDQVDVCAHPDAFAMAKAVAGRSMDGGALYEHLLQPGAKPYDGVAGVDPGDHAALDDRATRLRAWFERLISVPEPGEAGAWREDRFEYAFRCAAPAPGGARVYDAVEHNAGRLDWWSLDLDRTVTTLDGAPLAADAAVVGHELRTMIPAPLRFDGMPETRFWAFEDNKVNFGAVSTATSDLARLMLIDFAIVYGNDWFIVPFTAPAATVATLTGCAVTNTFGERFWIEPAARGLDDDERRFAMFNASVARRAREPADAAVMILPTAPHVVDGPVIEEILLLRDEVANMVWAVEKITPLPDGTTKPGLEAARARRAYLQRLASRAPDPAPPSVADARYTLMQTPPENWIPFIPVQTAPGARDVRLRRAALPRILEGDPGPPTRIEPTCSLLRAGLDQSPKTAFFVPEEEVPRSGARVLKRYQRCRWRNGRVVVWLAAQKGVGRGEGLSNLAFDRLVPTPQERT